MALILLVGLAFPNLYAQDTFSKVTSDFESWNSIRLKAKFNKKFTASLEQGLRLSKNSTTLEQALSEVEIGYKLTKGLEIGIGTRYIYDKTKNDNFENNFRVHLDASYKQKIERFDLKARLRYQNKSELVFGSEDIDEPQSIIRIKLSSGYNIKNWKLDPQLSSEIFRSLDSGGNFDKIRFTIATTYNLKKAGDIGIFYRLEKDINISLPKTTYIAGLKYTYTIKTF